ncbi:MAG: SDR family oxidoreductase [Chloroflexi bacterium]|nr:SDR family oxidoreductase [Bacteroidota bacterium]MCL5110981.1 SDR family oxidoreductase [Chloroflexota bacterium]
MVTGGASGLGREIALGLSRLGAAIAVADVNGQGAREVSEAILQRGGRGLAVAVDVTDRVQVDAAVQATVDRFGSLDILVNCAAIGRPGFAIDYPEEAWQTVLDVNLKGTLLACQAAGQVMTQRGFGRIVNFASTAGTFGQPKALAYSVSKAGVVQLTRTMAVEWGPYGVRVNAIAPGVFLTPMHERAKAANPAFFARFLSGSPLGRFGRPDEIVGVVAFLAARASDMITGQLIVVDGGFSAGGYTAG